MRALDQEVKDAVWAATEPLLPQREDSHPLGTHRRRVPDRLCFEGILVRLVTGCSWQTTERLLGCAVSDTTLRARRDEWIAAGVFDAVVEEAPAAFDRIVGLDLTEVAVDGSAHKAPSGGPGTGRNPTDRGKSGWLVSAHRPGRIPVGWAADGANRHDQVLFEPHPRHRRRPRPARRHRDPAPGPRLRQRPGTGPVPPTGASMRHHLRPPTTTRHRHAQNHHPTRAAMARRTDQLVAVELRTTPSQHRPVPQPPTRPTRPRHRPTHLHQTHRLAKPLVTTYPLSSNCRNCAKCASGRRAAGVHRTRCPSRV